MRRVLLTILLGGLLMTTEIHANLRCAGRSLGEAYRDPQALALVNAAVRGNGKKVEELVKQGADPNYLEEGSVSMLLWTLCAEEKVGFEALLKAGADPNLGSTGHGKGHGSQGASWRGQGTIVRRGWSAMVMAAGIEDPEILRLALNYGGDPDAQKGEDPAGENLPLLAAADAGLFDNVRALVAAGADINVHNGAHSAPWLAIAAAGRYDIALWLVGKGYSHDLEYLARGVESRHVPLDSPLQRAKELLIELLRTRGMKFPTVILQRRIDERVIPPEHVEDLIAGRRNVLDYPERVKRYPWRD